MPEGRYHASECPETIGAAAWAKAGLKREGIASHAGRLALELRITSKEASCPLCDRSSNRVHSEYSRKIAYLPRHGTPVVLRVHARRFFCDDPSCGRKIFCERLPELAARARKTDRLEEALLAIVSEPAEPHLVLEVEGPASERIYTERISSEDDDEVVIEGRLDHSPILGTELRFVFTSDRKRLAQTARGIREVLARFPDRVGSEPGKG